MTRRRFWRLLLSLALLLGGGNEAIASSASLVDLIRLLGSRSGRLVLRTREGRHAAEALSDAVFFRTGRRLDPARLDKGLGELASRSAAEVESLSEFRAFHSALERVDAVRTETWTRTERTRFISQQVEYAFRSEVRARDRFLRLSEYETPAPPLARGRSMAWLTRQLRFSSAAPVNAEQAMLDRLVVELDGLLTLGRPEEAVSRFNPLFLTVEKAFESARDLNRLREELLKSIADGSVQARAASVVLHRIDDFLVRQMRMLGSRIDEYVALRGHLEKRIIQNTSCSDSHCRDAARDFFERVGLAGREAWLEYRREAIPFYRDFVRMKGDGSPDSLRLSLSRTFSRPDLGDYEDFMHSESRMAAVARSARASRRFQLEAADVAYRLFSEPLLLRALYGALEQVSGKRILLKDPELVKVWFKEIVDTRARRVHFPLITYLIRSPASNAAKLAKLRDAIAADPDLLVAFARRTDAQRSYRTLLEEAARHPELEALHERMLRMISDSGSLARRLGELSLVETGRGPRRLALYLATGIGAPAAYAWYRHAGTAGADVDGSSSFLRDLMRMIGAQE